MERLKMEHFSRTEGRADPEGLPVLRRQGRAGLPRRAVAAGPGLRRPHEAREHEQHAVAGRGEVLQGAVGADLDGK